MNGEQKNLIIALLLSGAILFGWQYFVVKNQPQPTTVSEKKQNEQPAKSNPLNVELPSMENQAGDIKGNKIFSDLRESITANGNTLEVSNVFGVTQIKTVESDLSLKDVLGEHGSILIEVADQGDYQILDLKSAEIIKEPQDDGFQIQLKNLGAKKIRVTLNADKADGSGGAFSHPIKKSFLIYPSNDERFDVGKEKDGEAKVKWVGVDFNHNLLVANFNEVEDFRYYSKETGKLVLTSARPLDSLNLRLFLLKKNYDLLASKKLNLEQSVDFGVLWVISLPILRALQLSYKLFPNYGIGIILLTLLVRLLTYPLQYKSFVSMKKMQNLAPELAKIKERYKDDQVKAQQESMDLFKRTGVNPLGGCMPMLLQMPIFFAFYKVLQESVELVGAPFAFWIKDLSHKDPYYVLPILVGLVMVINQKMTPSPSMDPAQKKVMMIMPVVFSFFMKDLPSGLSLYFFVSMTVGILQQVWVNKKLSQTT